MASHLEAARGAYVVRPYRADRPKGGMILVQGTSATSETVKLLERGAFDADGLNVKIVATPSWDLFRRQPASYREAVFTQREWMDSTVVANCARRLMRDWMANKIAEEYAMTPDWDDRERTGGSVDEIIAESRINAHWILEGIRKFVADRPARLARLRAMLPEPE
jgi:transketolase